MLTINLKNYDFIWRATNFDYLSGSIWLNNEYRKRDFIITWQGHVFKTYISKKEREELSQNGYRLLTKRLPLYKTEVKRKELSALREFKKLKSKKIGRLDNQELARLFVKTVNLIQDLMKTYFWTEFFCYDGVYKNLLRYEKTNKVKYNKLWRVVIEMQKLKYRQRKYLNKFLFGEILPRFYQEIAFRFKIKDVRNYSYQELAAIMGGQKKQKINRSICVQGLFNDWQDCLGKEAQKIIEKLAIKTKGLKYLAGQIGNKGSYTGRARVITFNIKARLNKIIKEMKRGEVLIAGTTGPEIILACQKAGAIVTEEGGITSHAAIVSRELNIPCVIATKVATTFFKTGDWVEVDAYRGIVRKLQR